MTDKQYKEVNERITTMKTEDNILLKLTDFLVKEKLISVEERNHVVTLIEKGGGT